MMKKITDAGFRIAEVPVHHYHRAYGKSQFFNFRRLFRTAIDVFKLWFALVDPARAPEGGRRRCRGRMTAETAATASSTAAAACSITGGLGFIGSNLARQLVDLGADVLLVDSLIPDYGGNLFNIAGIADRVRVNIGDVRNETSWTSWSATARSSSTSPARSATSTACAIPYTDLDINCRAQLSMLEACRKFNPRRKVVFAGTRQVYGKPGSPARRRDPPRAADRRQRREQGGRRVLPPALQQRRSACAPARCG